MKPKTTKLISWNVNGMRATLKKGFAEFFNEIDADIFCIQETKMQEGQAEIDFPGYSQFWNSAIKKGYSGTLIFARYEPLSVSYGLGITEHDNEGRVITLEYDDFYLINVYTPNSQRGLLRLDYRMEWENSFRAYALNLGKKKPVIICGDLNVAHEEIDIKNVKSNIGAAGFTYEERDKMTELLGSGFIDTFRELYPDRANAYTWWSNFGNARANNTGWRIDYFIVSNRMRKNIVDSLILPEVMGSDHCPIELIIQ
jgi:exodeoxyribonuclease-3